jgi:protein-disulfide isomerase
VVTKDSNDDFIFSIEGKDYTISEKNSVIKDKRKQTLHAPSLTIGAIIAVICIAVVFFGFEEISEPSEQLIEKQMIEEPKNPVQITRGTFLDNGSPIQGDPNAPITLVEFGDYQCHFCNVYYHNTEHKIFKEYVTTGKVNIIFKDYTIIGPDSRIAALGAHCAGEQGKFWEYHNTLYDNWDGENNGWAGQENIFRFAEQSELNMDEFIECNLNKRYEQKISKSSDDARTLGITGTPAFYVISNITSQVQFISGAQPYDVFEKIFNSMLEN